MADGPTGPPIESPPEIPGPGAPPAPAPTGGAPHPAPDSYNQATPERWSTRAVWARVSGSTATVAILSAVIGALVAGVPTVVVAHMQVAAAEENARQSFAREQRYEAYARLKDAVVALQAQEQKSVDVVGESKGFVPLPSTTEEIDRIHGEVRSAYQEVRQAAAHIDSSIAAPDEVVRLAQELVSSQSVTVRSMVETPSSAYGRQDSQLDRVRAHLARSYEVYQQFSRAAGEELRPG